MSRLGLAALGGMLLAGASTLALAQTVIQTEPQMQALAPATAPFVAHANISVANNSPVPQTVAGTGVTPFQLMPHQQARLEMAVAPPPVAAPPGSSVPVRFQYSVGQGSGPQCRGTIDMTLDTRGNALGPDTVTNCVAHSIGTNGADCNIAVSAQNAMCQGGLAFSAR